MSVSIVFSIAVSLEKMRKADSAYHDNVTEHAFVLVVK